MKNIIKTFLFAITLTSLMVSCKIKEQKTKHKSKYDSPSKKQKV